MKTSGCRCFSGLIFTLLCLPGIAFAALPSILTQPTDQTVAVGSTATFKVTAKGSSPLCYQWNFNGTNELVGATNKTLTLTNVQPANAGAYSVTVTNRVGTVTSSNALLTVGTPPSITVQPANQAVVVDGTASFTVTAAGLAPLQYQWNFNGVNLANATNATLTLTNVQFNQAGDYAVWVTNTLGSILSSNALLMVNNPGTVPVCDEVDLQAAVAAGGTITFGCDGVITLTKTLAVTKPTTLDGTGHTVTISGSNTVRVFTVNGAHTLSLFNLTIANGLALGTNAVPGTTGGSGQGGGVWLNGGKLIVSNCLFLSNTAQGGNCGEPTGYGYLGNGGDGLGGAVYVSSGSLSLTNCNFFGNHANGGAGAPPDIELAGGGNAGNGFGGAIYCATSVVQMVNCEFKTNQSIGADAFTATYGNASSGGAYGGAVCELGGAVTNINGSFLGNQALASLASYRHTTGKPGQGGACYNSGGLLVVSGTSFTSNAVAGGYGGFGDTALSAPGQGGAVINAGSLQVSNCNFGYNRAAGGDQGMNGGSDGNGGAVYCAGPSSIKQSWFFGNKVTGGAAENGIAPYPGGSGKGGAIYNSNTVSIVSCTFSINEAFGVDAQPNVATPGYGGAIYNVGSCQLTNATLTGNLALGGNGYGSADAFGGAVYTVSNTVISVNNTFAANAARTRSLGGIGYGGAICNSNGTVTLYNTIVANSTSGSNCWGTMSDGGYNLSSDASAGFSAAGSLNNTDPKLGPLGDYGGPTPTVPLLAGSPAIDGGNTATAPATDQRGRARPYGAAADIGAFESSPPYFIGGQISGLMSVLAAVTIGSSNTVTTCSGSYGLEGFDVGSYTVTPSNSSFLFVPTNTPVTVGPDQVSVNFNAYRWNMVTIDPLTNGMLPLVFAATNGWTYRTLTSTNLTDWLPISTNTLGPDSYFRVFTPMTPERGRFYRTVSP